MIRIIKNQLKITGVLLAMLLPGSMKTIDVNAACFEMEELGTAADEAEITISPEVHIRKRAEWTDETTGEALLTLQYASNLNDICTMPDLNVVLVQDKSGSMDCNYGYNLEKTRSGWPDKPKFTEYYPILNGLGWTETVSDLKNEGREAYFKRLIYFDSDCGAACHESHIGFNNGMIHNAEMFMNSPCQMENHFYLLIQDESLTKTEAWQMVHGTRLYNISGTDLHHYILLNSRTDALEYLEKGRRVVRIASGGSYVDASGRQIVVDEKNTGDPNQYAYFLDVTKLSDFGRGWVLNTCGYEENQETCCANDRLHRSQEFMKELVEIFAEMNPETKIAYIPFWGAVPEDGVWENRTGDIAGSSLLPVTKDMAPEQITQKDGVTKLDFMTDISTLKSQIQNPFTYNGTNWSAAFEQVINLVEKQQQIDKANGKIRKTLVIFLTDGEPQGYAGQHIDVENEYINGTMEIAKLKTIEGVSIYACGICIGEEHTYIQNRLNGIDTKNQAFLARTLSDFSDLEEEVQKRVHEDYVIEVSGQDAIYTDVLSEEFTLDESKLDESWALLDEIADVISQGNETDNTISKSGTMYDIPDAVYQVFSENPGIQKVYVKNTKTIYWYIGTLTNGVYEAENHGITVPVKYRYFKQHTCENPETVTGDNQAVSANTEQKLTYSLFYKEGSAKEKEQRMTVKISTPQLLFCRGRSCVTVEKRIEGARFDTEQSYRFAYSKTKYTGGETLADAIGTFTISIPPGGMQGRICLYDLPEGTYYFYEVDETNTVVNTSVPEITIRQDGAINTCAYTEGCPPSVTTSEQESAENFNNVLTVSSSQEHAEFIDFYTAIQGTKIWDDNEDALDLRPKTYTVKLYQNGIYVTENDFLSGEPWAFHNLKQYDLTGKAYHYTVEEDPIVVADGYRYVPSLEGHTLINTLKWERGKITIVKQIPSETIQWEHGNPIFTIRVNGISTEGQSCEFYHTYEFTKEYVEEHACDGMVSMAFTFENLPYSERYVIEEACVSRYDLTKISFGDAEGQACEVLSGNQNTGFYDRYGCVKLNENNSAWTVTLKNKPVSLAWYSDKAVIENKIEW